MTCKEKFIKEHPNYSKEELDLVFFNKCPSDYDIMDDPCDAAGNMVCHAMTCVDCWKREIPNNIDAPILDPNEVTKLNEIVETVTEKEKSDMSITRKTKQELIDEISALNKELEATSKIDKYTTFADEIYSMYQAFMNSGFSDERAYELVKLLIMHQLHSVNV